MTSSSSTTASESNVSDVPKKLVVYDFDQTITAQHLYHQLGGGRLDELRILSDSQLTGVFGGQARVDRLRQHFDRVSATATLSIISFGYTDVIRQALQRMNLLHFKACVVIGRDSKELCNNSKADCIRTLSKEQQFDRHEVLFVDDDKANLQRANPCCDTLFIFPRTGMSELHMQRIEKVCGFDASKDLANGSSSKSKSNSNSNSNSNPSDPSDNHENENENENENQNENATDNEHNENHNTQNPISHPNPKSTTQKTHSKDDWKSKYSISAPQWFDDLHKEPEEVTPVVVLRPHTPSDSEEPFPLVVPRELKASPTEMDADAVAINNNRAISGISLSVTDN